MSKLQLYLGGVLIALFLLVVFIQIQRNIGGETERLKQEKENADFQNNARKGGSAYDECERAGKLFDFRKGTCK